MGYGAEADGKADEDIARIQSHLKLTNAGEVIVEFTLYPDGSCKWLRCMKPYTQSEIPETACLAIKNALMASTPLKLARKLGLKQPEPASLSLLGLGNQNLNLGLCDAVGEVIYTFDKSSRDNSPPWLLADKKEIEAHLKLPKSASRDSACVWFRLNPDATTECCTPVHIDSIHSNSKARLDGLLCEAIKLSKLQYGPDSVIDLHASKKNKAPLGVLAIIDGGHLYLRLCSFMCKPVLKMKAH